ncbi:MAG: hypothetical protein KF784_00285 [Fimbriimonadaceae bacterium]|nr:hypothetical protein [Fimbriimonadaceae bacterium]
MKTPGYYRRRQKSAVFVGMLLFQLVLLLLQLWLFVAAFENLLAGHTSMAIPAALASLAILAINIWMLKGVDRMSSDS